MPPPGAFIHSSLVLNWSQTALGTLHTNLSSRLNGQQPPCGIDDGPGSVVAVLGSRCGQHGQHLWLSAGLYGQGASGRMDKEHRAIWTGSIGPPVSLTSAGKRGRWSCSPSRSHMCVLRDSNFAGAGLKVQLSFRDPQMPLRAKTPGALSCFLKHSASVSLSNVCMWKAQSAGTCSLHTCFMMDLFSQAR